MRIANVTEAMYGKEPPTDNLSEALNWYSSAVSKEQKKEWFLTYLQEIGEDTSVASIVPDSSFITAGSVARLWSRGVRTDSFLSKLEEFRKAIQKEGEEISLSFAADSKKKAAIKEGKFKAEVSEAVSHIETVIDEFMTEGSIKFDALEWIRSNKISQDVQKVIRDRYKKLLDEVIASETDPYLKEGYSNFSKKQKVSFINLLTDIVSTKPEKVSTRKPRRKKVKTPDKIVKKLQYLKEFKEMNLVSIDPELVVGSKSLWVYNVKYRVLTNYVSDSGLSVKGTTLLNINEEESKSKKVRKPNTTIVEVLKTGKVGLRKVFDNLTTGFLKINGRINKDTILLRVW